MGDGSKLWSASNVALGSSDDVFGAMVTASEGEVTGFGTPLEEDSNAGEGLRAKNRVSRVGNDCASLAYCS